MVAPDFIATVFSEMKHNKMATQIRVDNPLLGVSAMLFSVSLFSMMDATVKWLGGTYPVHQIVFFRCTVALVPVLLFVARAGGLRILKTQRSHLHALRCLFGLSAMGCAFYSFSVMRLADAVSVFYSAPLFITALSVPLLGEKVGIRRWSAVIVGFIGILIVVRPSSQLLNSGGIYMLAAALFVGLTMIIIRRLSATDDAASITFYFTLSGVLVSSVISLCLGWAWPPIKDLMLLIAVGLLGGCAQYAMTVSFRYAEVGLVAPLRYLSIVSGGVLGYLLWSEVPDMQSVLGMTVIIASGLYTIHREAVLSRRIR